MRRMPTGMYPRTVGRRSPRRQAAEHIAEGPDAEVWFGESDHPPNAGSFNLGELRIKEVRRRLVTEGSADQQLDTLSIVKQNPPVFHPAAGWVSGGNPVVQSRKATPRPMPRARFQERSRQTKLAEGPA